MSDSEPNSVEIIPLPLALPVGRPSTLTPELLENLVALIRRGYPLSNSCRAVGVSRTTRQYWMRRGQKEADRVDKGETPLESEARYLEFYYRIQQALALLEMDEVAYIRSCKSWRARAWLLAHMNPEQWGEEAPTEDVNDPPPVMRVVDMWEEDGKWVSFDTAKHPPLPPNP